MAKNDDLVGDLKYIAQVVGDEDYPLPLAPQRVDQRQNSALLRNAERGRRFVHDHELGVPVDGAADGDRLALASRERCDRRAQPRDVKIETRHHLFRRSRHHRPIEDRQKAEQLSLRLTAKKDVLADRQVVRERKVLINRFDAILSRLVRRCEGDRFAAQQNLAESCLKTPEMALMMVDLPAPLSPASATTSPGWTSNDTPFSA